MDTSYANLYFPHVDTAGSWETEICLINTDTSASATGTLYGYRNDGTLVSPISISLAANARQQITVGQLQNSDQIGYMLFESNATKVVGYTKFFINNTYRAAIPAVGSITTGNLYVTHIASVSNEWWTGISLVNTTSASKTLTIEFNTGESRSITLAPLEHKAFTIESLFGGQAKPSIISGKIQNAAGVIGLELFGSNTELDGVPLSDSTSTNLYYPHIASDSTWWTGIVAYNPNSTPANIQIKAYHENGNLLNILTPSPLAAGGKYVGLASGLGLPNGTAWLQIVSDQPSAGLNFLEPRITNAWQGIPLSISAQKVAPFQK